MFVKKDTAKIYQVYIPSNQLFGDQISLVELTTREIDSLGEGKEIIIEDKDVNKYKILNHLKSNGFLEYSTKDEVIFKSALDRLNTKKDSFSWLNNLFEWIDINLIRLPNLNIVS